MGSHITNNKEFKKAGTLTILVFAFSFAAFSCFLTPIPGDNINTRLNLTAAIINHGDFKIDKWHLNTIDKAYVDGHYYSDKAPGLSLAAVPAAWLYSFAGPVDPGNIIFRHVCTMLLVSLPAAILAGVFFVAALSASGNTPLSFGASAALVFGTLWFPYSTLFYGHVPAAAVSFILFYVICHRRRPGAATLLAAGFAAAWMAVTDYPAAAHAIALLVLALFTIERKWSLLWLAPGVAAVAAVFFFYNHAAFGEWFTIGYLHESYGPFAEAHSRGLGGMTVPSPAAFYEILLKPGKGLFFLSPFLLFSIPGFFKGVRDERWRKPVLAAGAIVLIHTISNASLPIPGGGMAAGPRHLAGMMPYMVFLCLFAVKGAGRFASGAFWGLVIMSCAANLLVAATNPQAPEIMDAPVIEYCFELFKNGVIRPAWFSPLIPEISQGYLLYGWLLAIFFLILTGVFLMRKEAGRATGMGFAGMAAALALAAGMYYLAGDAYRDKSPAHKRYSLGMTYLQMDSPALALKEYRKALEIDPDHALTNFSLGKMAHRAGAHDTAIERFRRTVESNSSIAEAHYNLAVLLFERGGGDEAYKHFAYFVETERMGKTLHKARAMAYMALIEHDYGNGENAELLLEWAERLHGEDSIVKKARHVITAGD